MIERFAGRYELLRRLGRGGLGEVFLARDLANGQECALKRLPAAAAGAWREFELPARLRHPAIVAVLEIGVAPDGTPFYTMEYVPGLPADRALGPGEWPALLFVAAEVAGGLEALHAQGVVHGDLKPPNVLVVPGPGPGAIPAAVRLVDFGFAALGSGEGHRGSAGFVAPEVVRGERAGVAADLYGLGSTLYALAAGRPAFSAGTIGEVLARQQAGPPDAMPLEEVGAPPRLVRLVLRLMAPAAGERPRDAREVRRELEAIHPAARRPLAVRLRTAVVAGRERELALLERRLARGGEGRVVVLCGEGGIGKSALHAELARRLALAGRPALAVACGSASGSGGAALVLLRRLAAEAGVSLEDPRHLPDPLPGHLSEIPARRDLQAIADAATAWQRRIEARGAAPVVLLDDADHLDPVSRSLVRRLVLHPEAPATLWVWTRRGARGEAPEDERALAGAGVLDWIELGRLDEDGVERLAAARLAAEPPRDLSAGLWERGAGHPGLTVELLLEAAARGALREEEAGLTVDPAALAGLEAPGFEALLERRLGALPGPCGEAIAALAVLGRPSAAERLRELVPAFDEQQVRALLESGLAIRDAGGRLAPASPGFAERVLAAAEPAARRDLHRRALAEPGLGAAQRFHLLAEAGDAGEALRAAEAAFAERPDAALAAAAADLAAPTDGAAAARWHERAGRELAAAGRHRAAIPHLERALAADPGAEERHARRQQLSNAYLRAGEPGRLDALLAAALADHPPPALRARLLVNEAALLQTRGRFEESCAAGREALRLAEGAGDDEAAGYAAQALVYSCLALEAWDEADSMCVRAGDAFERARSAFGRLRAAAARAEVARARRRNAAAERIYRDALAEARALGQRLAVEEILASFSLVLLDAGRWDETRDLHLEAARLALEDQRPRGAAHATVNLAVIDGLTGHPGAALRRARAAIRLARAYLPHAEAAGWRALAQALRIAGRTGRAERAARRALALAAEAGFPEEAGWCRAEYGRVLAAAGSWAEAGRVWERGLEAAAPASAPQAVLALLAGRAALRAGEDARAAARLAAAEEWLRDRPMPYLAALAQQLRAEIALSRGRLQEAQIAVDRTIAGFAPLPAPPERAGALLEFARLAAGRTLPVPAAEWLRAAAADFERLGDQRSRLRALAHQAEWLREARAATRPVSHDRDLIEAVSSLLHSLSDLRELSHRAMQLAVDQIGADLGVLLLQDPETGRLQPIAEIGSVDDETRSRALTYSSNAVQRVAESGDIFMLHDASSRPGIRSPSMERLKLESILCVPMFVGGRVIGAVYVHSRRANAFGEDDRKLLQGFAHLMAVAIEKSRGEEEVRRTNEILVEENLSLRQEANVRFQADRLLGTSRAMQRVRGIVELVAKSMANVLITGENGTGKDLIARIIHHASRRRSQSFVAFNCGSLTDSLRESQLFGVEDQVATGVRKRDGLFKQADGGTLFLDEIGDLPLHQQPMLLRAIANREITPVGGKTTPVDVRLITATHRDLRRMVEEKQFRQDLYYRINVVQIEVPPLRERKEDIPLLTRHFVALHAARLERPLPRIPPEFMAMVMQCDWPGNVRELENYVERVMAMNPGNVLRPTPPPQELQGERPARLADQGTLPEQLADLERRLILAALERAGGNQSRAARLLGITEQAIRFRMRRLGVSSVRQIMRMRHDRRPLVNPLQPKG